MTSPRARRPTLASLGAYAALVSALAMNGPARAAGGSGGSGASDASGGSDGDAGAKAAYQEAAAAYDAHDYARAARGFARADELSPNPVVLKLALAAALRADAAVVGMTLALRAGQRPGDAETVGLARRARSAFASRTALVRVACAERAGCHATVGDRQVGDGEVIVAPPGPVDVAFEDGDVVHVVAPAGATIDVRQGKRGAPTTASSRPSDAPAPASALASPAPPPSPPPQASSGWPPSIFFAGAAASVVLGGATLVSAVDTVRRHDAFERDPSSDTQASGRSSQTRTDVLFFATAAVVAATAVVGLFFTRWSHAPARSAASAPTPAL